MAKSRARRSDRKRRSRYHHGDLPRALLDAGVGIIQERGVDALTLRAVGEQLGVSRTALYRHFADKSALLAAVASEGFRMLRLELLEAWARGKGGREGFEAMGLAYVGFALEHPSHYRVMFGGFVRATASNPQLVEEATAAFQALVDALTALQRDGVVRREDPLQLARFIWAVVHGIAMLAIDGQLRGPDCDPQALTRQALDRIRTGITAIPA